MRSLDDMDEGDSGQQPHQPPSLQRPHPLVPAAPVPAAAHATPPPAASVASAPTASRSIFTQPHANYHAALATPTKSMAGLTLTPSDASPPLSTTDASVSPMPMPIVLPRSAAAATAAAAVVRVRPERALTDASSPRSAPVIAPSPSPAPSASPAPAPGSTFTSHARSRTHSFLSPNEEDLHAATAAAATAHAEDDLSPSDHSYLSPPAPAHDKPQAKKIKAYHSSPAAASGAQHGTGSIAAESANISNHTTPMGSFTASPETNTSASAHTTPVQRAQESSFGSPVMTSPSQRGMAGALGLSIALPQPALHCASPFVVQVGGTPTQTQQHPNPHPILALSSGMMSPPFAPTLPPFHLSASQTPDGRSSSQCSFSRAPWGSTASGRSSSHIPSALPQQHQHGHHPQHQHGHGHAHAASSVHFPASLLSRASSTLPFNHHHHTHSHHHPPHAASQQSAQHLYDGTPVRINVPVPDASATLGPAAQVDDDDCATDTDDDDATGPPSLLHVEYKHLLPTIKNSRRQISAETMMELLKSIQATGGTLEDGAAAGVGAGAASSPVDPWTSPETTPPISSLGSPSATTPPGGQSTAAPPGGPAVTPPGPGGQFSTGGLPGGQFSGLYRKLIIIDARWPYEFAGGHIRGATNLWKPEQVFSYFLRQPPASMADGQRICVVFHCEYSQQRGPQLFDRLRGRDRDIHGLKQEWSSLFYPEMYVLQGGYKHFYETFGPAANSVVNTPRAETTPGPMMTPSPLPSYRSLALAGPATAAGEAIVRCESVPLQDNSGHSTAPQSARAHKPLPSAAAAANRLRPHAKSSGASVQSTAAAAAVASALSPRSFACSPAPAPVSAIAQQRASSPFLHQPLPAPAAFQSIAASARQHSAAGLSAASPLGVPSGNAMEDTLDQPVASAAHTTAAAGSSQSAPVSAVGESSFSAFHPASASYVPMLDPRFKAQRLVHTKEADNEKRNLTRSASTGTLGGAHGAAPASGAATPCLPITAPPTPPTRPQSSLGGGSNTDSPLVSGSGSGGASGLPSPMVLPHVSTHSGYAAAANSTGLTPRMGSTSLSYNSPGYAVPLPSAIHMLPDAVDCMRDELARARRRSLSLSNSQNRSSAGTPMLVLSSQSSAAGADAHNASELTPSTPVFHGRSLPPTGRDLMSSLTATLSTQQHHQQVQTPSSVSSSSSFDHTGLLFSPIGNGGSGSSRSPGLVRSASVNSEMAAAAAAGADANMQQPLPLHSFAAGLPLRARQSPSPTSRGLFSSSSNSGSAVASPSSRAVSAGGFGFGGSQSQSQSGGLNSGYSSLNSSTASLNQSGLGFGSPLQLGLSGGGTGIGLRSLSAAAAGGGAGGSSYCSPVFAGVVAGGATGLVASPRQQGRGSPHIPQQSQAQAQAPHHPPLPASPPQLAFRSRSDFSSVNQAKRASASSASIQAAMAAAAAAAALSTLEKARLLSGTPVIPECSPTLFDESGVAVTRGSHSRDSRDGAADSPSLSLSRVAGSSPPPLLPEDGTPRSQSLSSRNGGCYPRSGSVLEEFPDASEEE